MNFNSVKKALDELKWLLVQLSDDEYTKPVINLSNASIGQHSRHIIELFQCLLNSYESAELNYDYRERNKEIENSSEVALAALDKIIDECQKDNKKLMINQLMDGDNLRIETNYYRELLYNLEHCIHHQALIKVALYDMNSVVVDENFGVAQSTIEYKKQCAQ